MKSRPRLPPLPPDNMPTRLFATAELRAAYLDGTLVIHDNGVLTVGDVQVVTPAYRKKVVKRLHSNMSPFDDTLKGAADVPEREHPTPERVLFAKMFPSGNVPNLRSLHPIRRPGRPRKRVLRPVGEPTPA